MKATAIREWNAARRKGLPIRKIEHYQESGGDVMRVGHSIGRREFLAVISTAVAAGLLGLKAFASAQYAGEEVGLGRVQFDPFFRMG